jgi:putative phosphoesterase
MLIGIFSDTHDQLIAIDRALEVFRQRKVDLVVHGGDLISPFAAKRLKAGVTVPLHIIYGNNDGERDGLKKILPQIQDGPMYIEAAGKTIAVHHDPALLPPEAVKKADIIVVGHTHDRQIETRDGKLFLNPGECCGWLTGKGTVALLDPAAMKVEIVELTL